MDLSRMAQLAVGRLNVHSALNPFLWLVGIVVVVAVPTAAAATDPFLRWACFILAALVVGVALYVGVLFALRSPEKLQSEEFQLRQQSLTMLQGVTESQVIEAQAIVAIANPGAAAPALSVGAGGEHP